MTTDDQTAAEEAAQTEWEEMRTLAEEHDALRARAQAAEQRAEALAAELAQARADARVLVGQMWAVDEQLYTEDVLVPAGLTATEVNAVRDSYDHTLPVAEVVAVIRRALGGAA